MNNIPINVYIFISHIWNNAEEFNDLGQSERIMVKKFNCTRQIDLRGGTFSWPYPPGLTKLLLQRGVCCMSNTSRASTRYSNRSRAAHSCARRENADTRAAGVTSSLGRLKKQNEIPYEAVRTNRATCHERKSSAATFLSTIKVN